MRIILDTNVLVALEDAGQTAPEVARLAELAHEHGVRLLIHPGSLEDLGRDRDVQRQAASISKAGKYPILADPPEPPREWIEAVGGSATNPRDLVDNRLLYAIERKCASFLVTEDRGAHRKAARLGIDGSVYYISQAVDALVRLFERITNPPTVVNVRELHSLDVSHTFFDSLREDYDFDEWFGRVAQQGRQCWVIGDPVSPDAVCIFKEEEIEGRAALKLCTFKVGEHRRGRHYGELLLKAAFAYCTANGLEAAWVEVKREGGSKDYLIQFLEGFGFEEFDTPQGDDATFIKRFIPVDGSLEGIDFHRAYSPAVDWSRPRYVVPIQPGYHDILFPDAPGVQQSMLADENVVGHGIRKAYLSHSNIRKLEAGDVLLFYRSGDLKAITTVGVVEHAMREIDSERIAGAVSKRTVYSLSEIEQMASRETLAVMFRQAFHLRDPISRFELLGEGVLKGAPQQFVELDDARFSKIQDRLLP